METLINSTYKNPSDDVFYAYCVKNENSPNLLESIYITKFTFDKKKYYVVNSKERLIDHPLIKGTSLSELIKNRSGGFRHCKIWFYNFNKKDNTCEISEAAMKYLTIDNGCLKFILNGKILTEENIYRSFSKAPNLGQINKLKSFDSDGDDNDKEIEKDSSMEIVPFDANPQSLSSKRLKSTSPAFDLDKRSIQNYSVIDSTINDNLPLLMKTFSKFRLFNTIKSNGHYLSHYTPKSFIDRFELHILNNYGVNGLKEAVNIFYLFLDESENDLFEWYFENKFNNWEALKASFLNQTSKLVYDYHYLSTLPLYQFLNHLSLKDKSVKDSIDTCPLSTYMLKKYKLFKVLYPNIIEQDVLRLCSSFLSEGIFTKFDNLSFNAQALKFNCKMIEKDDKIELKNNLELLLDKNNSTNLSSNGSPIVYENEIEILKKKLEEKTKLAEQYIKLNDQLIIASEAMKDSIKQYQSKYEKLKDEGKALIETALDPKNKNTQSAWQNLSSLFSYQINNTDVNDE